jgi:lysophospholipase L1-like esterase
MDRARRLTAVAAACGGGLAAAGALGFAAFAGLIVGETRLVRRRVPSAEGKDPPAVDDTLWTADGACRDGAVIEFAIAGDSLAAGYGAQRPAETPGGLLASTISAAAGRPVRLRSVASIGANSLDLDRQVAALGDQPLDLVMIIIGANDVSQRIGRTDSIAHLEAAVRALTERGVPVVVGTCPDPSALTVIPQPLRAHASRTARRLAAAQTAAAVRAGARTVPLGTVLRPLFHDRPEMLSSDRFHPSATGYRAATAAALPCCLDAIGIPRDAAGTVR